VVEAVCQQLEETYPAYVLDAIDPAERKQVDEHIAVCSACAQIVAGYRPVADALSFAATQVEPPAGLRQRVLAATMPAPRTSIARALASFFDLLHAPAFSAATLALLIVLGIWNLSLQNQLSQQAIVQQQLLDEMMRQREFTAVLASAPNQSKSLQGTEVAARSWGRLYGAVDQQTFALLAYNLPPLDAGKVYQLWLIDASGDRTSGGTFTVDEKGRGWLLIQSPKPLNYYQGIGITVEPDGGSPAPTGPRMMGTSL